MATLKMCGKRNVWVTSVKKLTHLGNFDLEGDSRSDMAVFSAIEKAGLKFSYPAVTLMSFEAGDYSGVVVLIEREKGLEDRELLYIFPYRSGFLMSDKGHTIDRI